MIGTSEGLSFQDDYEWAQFQLNPTIEEDSAPKDDLDDGPITARMPPGASRKPADALKSQQGTKTIPPRPIRLAGDVVPLPIYPGLAIDRIIGMERLKSKIMERNPNESGENINKAFDSYFGGGAKILPGPGYTK